MMETKFDEFQRLADDYYPEDDHQMSRHVMDTSRKIVCVPYPPPSRRRRQPPPPREDGSIPPLDDIPSSRTSEPLLVSTDTEDDDDDDNVSETTCDSLDPEVSSFEVIDHNMDFEIHKDDDEEEEWIVLAS